MKYYEYKIDFDNNLKSSTNLKATTHNGSMHGAWVENPLSLSLSCLLPVVRHKNGAIRTRKDTHTPAIVQHRHAVLSPWLKVWNEPSTQHTHGGLNRWGAGRATFLREVAIGMSVWSMSSYIWHDTVEWTTPTGSKKELDKLKKKWIGQEIGWWWRHFCQCSCICKLIKAGSPKLCAYIFTIISRPLWGCITSCLPLHTRSTGLATSRIYAPHFFERYKIFFFSGWAKPQHLAYGGSVHSVENLGLKKC